MGSKRECEGEVEALSQKALGVFARNLVLPERWRALQELSQCRDMNYFNRIPVVVGKRERGIYWPTTEVTQVRYDGGFDQDASSGC